MKKILYLEKSLKEAPNFQLATVRGTIVRKSMGSDPMGDSFLAFRDSCREWFPMLFFSAREFSHKFHQIENIMKIYLFNLIN